MTFIHPLAVSLSGTFTRLHDVSLTQDQYTALYLWALPSEHMADTEQTHVNEYNYYVKAQARVNLTKRVCFTTLHTQRLE